MCDGSTRAIDQVEEGEWVLARDEKSGAVECRQVVAPYANPERAIIELELVDEQGLVEVIETTDNHPFFVEGQGFTRVDELLLGDRIPSGDGAVLEVERIYLTGRIETVYNFGVDDFRTYFVGQSGAWVHNCFEKTRDYLKNTDPTDVDEATVVENILGDGFQHRWGDKKRVHFEDADGKIRARIDPPDGVTKQRHLHLYNKNGESLDVAGNVVPSDSPEAHIRLE